MVNHMLHLTLQKLFFIISQRNMVDKEPNVNGLDINSKMDTTCLSNILLLSIYFINNSIS